MFDATRLGRSPSPQGPTESFHSDGLTNPHEAQAAARETRVSPNAKRSRPAEGWGDAGGFHRHGTTLGGACNSWVQMHVLTIIIHYEAMLSMIMNKSMVIYLYIPDAPWCWNMYLHDWVILGQMLVNIPYMEHLGLTIILGISVHAYMVLNVDNQCWCWAIEMEEHIMEHKIDCASETSLREVAHGVLISP